MARNNNRGAQGLLERLCRSRKLPLGHVERKRAEEAVDREYQSVREQEQVFNKRLPKKFRGKQEPEKIRKLITSLCFLTGTKEPKLCFNSTKVHCLAGAHYCQKEIHFKWEASIKTAIHELTHHINYMDCSCCGHGKEFLAVEQILFDVFMSEVLPVWKEEERWS